MPSVISKIRGTFEVLFRLGKDGPQLKSNAGAIEHRNSDDTAFAISRGASPVGNDDHVTLQYFNDNNNAAVATTVVSMPLLLATKVSSTAIPDNATIFDCWLDIETAYDGGVSWQISRTGDGSVILNDTTDNDPDTACIYHVPQTTNWGSTGAGTVEATLSGGVPTVGAATVYIAYATPNDIT